MGILKRLGAGISVLMVARVLCHQKYQKGEVLTTEDWNEVLFYGMHTVGHWTFIYFLLLMLIGNYILLNLLVAILVDGVAVQKEEADNTEELFRHLVEKHMIGDHVANENDLQKEIELSGIELDNNLMHKISHSHNQHYPTAQDITIENQAPCDAIENESTHPDAYAEMIFRHRISLAVEKAAERYRQKGPEKAPFSLRNWCATQYENSCFYPLREHTFWFFPPENSLRATCLALVQGEWFDNVVLVIILISCIFMAMEDPSIEPGTTKGTIVLVSSYVFTILFIIEISIKILAHGLIIGKNAFLKSAWNVLDGIMVVSSTISMMLIITSSSSDVGILGLLRVMRVLRVLRPLRVVNRAEGLRLACESLVNSFKGIGNVLLICGLFSVIFGILGVQLFKGTMYYCSGESVANVTNKAECLASGNQWVNAKFNFDHLGKALVTLFVMSTIDGWVSLMHQGIDAVDVDKEPVKNYNQWVIIYYVVYIITMSFLVLNLFVCVLVENYQKTNEELKAGRKEQREQENRLRKESRKQIKEERRKTYGKYRMKVYALLNGNCFLNTMLFILIANAIAMSTVHYNMWDMMVTILDYINFVFTGIYILEALVKIAVYFPCGYINERRHCVEILLILTSLAGILMDQLISKDDASGMVLQLRTLLRILQAIFLFVRLLINAKKLRSLVDTIVRTLPHVANLTFLFFLMFFIFSALGVELFGLITCDLDHECDGLGEHAHFQNFGIAFLTLFRIATGDNWNGIYKDALRTKCDSSDDCRSNCCVNDILGTLYFFMFVMISQFILLNIVVAMLLKGFEETTAQERETANLQEEEAAAADVVENSKHSDNVPAAICDTVTVVEQNDSQQAKT